MKKLAALLSLVLISVILVACGSSEKTSGLEAIKERKKLIVATESEFAPFEFKTLIDGKDELVGADIELAKAIGQKLGVEVEFSVMSFNNVLASVTSGQADLAIAGISVTDERKQAYDFSKSYYQSENVIIVKKSDALKYQSADHLVGQSIGVQKGSVQETVLAEQMVDAKAVPLTSNGEMINELKTGKLEAVILEKAIAEGYIKQNPELTLSTISLNSDDIDSYAVAMAKGNKELQDVVNQVIDDVIKSGQFDDWLAEAANYTEK